MRNLFVWLNWVGISLFYFACDNPSSYIWQEDPAGVTDSFSVTDFDRTHMDSIEQILFELKRRETLAKELSLSMSSLIAQASKELPTDMDNQLYMTIENVPSSLLPRNKKKLVVGGKPENSRQAIFAVSDTGKLDTIAYLPKDFAYNPHKKTQAYFENGKFFICSEQPYKATIICGIFRLENRQLILEESTYRDLSAEAIGNAHKALENNQFIEAVNYLEQVRYPQQYMQVEEEVINLLQKAYPIVLSLEKQQDYEQATKILERIFDFWGADFLHKLKTPQEVTTLFVSSNFDMSAQTYLSILKTYGRLLVQTEKYLKAVQINKQLIELLPDYAPAHLQLWDAYYGLEKLEESKIAYQHYKRLQSKQKDSLCERVLNRLKEK